MRNKGTMIITVAGQSKWCWAQVFRNWDGKTVDIGKCTVDVAIGAAKQLGITYRLQPAR